MNENDEYFSEDYAPESVTDKKIKDRKPSDIPYTEFERKEPYTPGKPHRTIIKAKITHD